MLATARTKPHGTLSPAASCVAARLSPSPGLSVPTCGMGAPTEHRMKAAWSEAAGGADTLPGLSQGCLAAPPPRRSTEPLSGKSEVAGRADPLAA